VIQITETDGDGERNCAMNADRKLPKNSSIPPDDEAHTKEAKRVAEE
jgi:hypothetical protein